VARSGGSKTDKLRRLKRARIRDPVVTPDQQLIRRRRYNRSRVRKGVGISTAKVKLYVLMTDHVLNHVDIGGLSHQRSVIDDYTAGMVPPAAEYGIHM
jgi:hypothetical protein